ncbi:MAG: hypothetical protein NC548_63405, partial [Lachnospiraceae bacterium]|nr:hypothetical protein [Lachnospiraceae bacterium]
MKNEQTAESNSKPEIAATNAFNISEMMKIAWRAKYLIILSVAICMCASYFVYKRQSIVYSSDAEVMLLFGDEESANASAALKELANINGVATSGNVNINNELEVMRSPELLVSVVEKLNLATTYTTEGFGHSIDLYGNAPVLVNFMNLEPDTTASMRLHKTRGGDLIATRFMLNGVEKQSKPLRIIPGTVVETPIGTLSISATAAFNNFPEFIDVTKRSVKGVANELSDGIATVRKDQYNSIGVITYNDVSQQRAIDVVNGVIKAYSDLWVEEKTRSSANTSRFINERLSVIEKELNGIDSDISQVKSSSQVVDPSSAATTYYGQSMEYDNRAFEANTQLQIAKYLRDYINDSGNADALIPANTGTNGAVESQIQEYNKLLVKRDQLLQNSTEANPVIAQMNSDLVKNRALILSSLNNIISTYQIEVNRAQGRKSDFTGKVRSMPEQEKRILSIERQQKVKENLYLYLLQKREENELSRMVDVNNIRVIHAAEGNGPISKALIRNLLIGLIVGLAIPFGIIAMMLNFNTKVSRRSDLSALSIPFLGEMPISPTRRTFKR